MSEGTERDGRLICQSEFEELSYDGSRDVAAGLTMPERRRIVEAHINANYEIRSEADEPGIFLIIGGPGFSSDSLQHLQLLCRAPLDAAFHDVDGMIRRHPAASWEAIAHQRFKGGCQGWEDGLGSDWEDRNRHPA